MLAVDGGLPSVTTTGTEHVAHPDSKTFHSAFEQSRQPKSCCPFKLEQCKPSNDSRLGALFHALTCSFLLFKGPGWPT